MSWGKPMTRFMLSCTDCQVPSPLLPDGRSGDVYLPDHCLVCGSSKIVITKETICVLERGLADK